MTSHRDLRGSIAGRAVGPDGAPLPSASVAAYTVGGLRTASADAEGRFRLDDVRALPHQMLWVSDDAYSRVRLENVCVFPDRVVDLGDVMLPEGCRVQLRVVDEDGKPIAGAEVTGEARQMFSSFPRDGPPRMAITDATGCCAFPAWGPGFALIEQLRIAAQGYRSDEHGFHIERPTGVLDLGDIVLSRHPVIFEGRVVDQDRRGLGGATVWDSHHPAAETLSEADGSFRLESWSATPNVSARKDGYSSKLTGTFRDDEGRENVVLRRIRWLQVRVTDAAGEPLRVSSASLEHLLEHDDGTASSCLHVTTWEDLGDGRFRIEWVEPGRHSFRVTAEGHAPSETTLTITEDGPNEVAIQLEEQAGSEPANEPEPLPVLQRPVCMTLWWPWRFEEKLSLWRGCVTTPMWYPRSWGWGEAGAIDESQMPPLYPNAWYSMQGPSGKRLWFRTSDTLDDNVIRLENGTITGRVVDFDPVWAGHAWVVAFHDGPVLAESRVRRDGSFELNGVPAGEYGLRVGDEGTLAHGGSLAEGEEVDAWRGATRVEVKANAGTEGVELSYRAP